MAPSLVRGAGRPCPEQIVPLFPTAAAVRHALSALLLVAPLAGALAAPPVVVEAVSDARAPAVQVKPAGNSSVSIPACRGVVWQRFSAEENRYVAVTTDACGPAAPALVVTGEGRRFDIDGKVSEGDVVRPLLVVGTGCAAARPFDLAGCKGVESVEGPTITVRGD